MTNSVLDALLESLEGLKVTFGETPESFKGDRFQTGEVREASVSELLRSYFPTTWTVGKGPIYDSHGQSSHSIDSVLCSPSHPPMRTGKRTVLLAEAVHSVTETKPDLRSKTEFQRGLVQIASVKRLRRDMNQLALAPEIRADVEHYRIPCALFAAKIDDLASVIDYMDAAKEAEGILPTELPDLVVALDKGIVFHTPAVQYSTFRTIAATRANLTEGEAYLVLPESGHRVLAWYLHALYGFAAPDPYVGEPVLRRYLGGLTFPEGFRMYRAH